MQVHFNTFAFCGNEYMLACLIEVPTKTDLTIPVYSSVGSKPTGGGTLSNYKPIFIAHNLWGLFLKERICSFWSKFLPLRIAPDAEVDRFRLSHENVDPFPS